MIEALVLYLTLSVGILAGWWLRSEVQPMPPVPDVPPDGTMPEFIPAEPRMIVAENGAAYLTREPGR